MGEPFPTLRAQETIRHLAGTIGLRIPGQPGFQQALTWLKQELQSIPGWEVEVQEAAASWEFGKTSVATRHANLVARLPGNEQSAILVNSHLDSPPESVGAADDGAAVAVMLEAARHLAAGPRPRHSLIFLFNGSEEYGLQGAVSFVEQNPWARDVAAFINLEAAGCSGPFTLFQASTRLPALLDAYSAVAGPSGTVAGQDLFASRIFQNDTDYRVFASHGLHGIDLALTGDGYAYHTRRDQPERVSPATLAEMGSTLMTLLRRLDKEPDLTPRARPEPRVYFDLLGRLFVTYPLTVAPILWAVAALLGGYAILGLPWWSGLLRHLGMTLAALLLPAGAAWLMGRLTRFETWWFAHPAPTGFAWASLALGAMAAVQALAPLTPETAWAGVLVFWLLLGALAVWKRLGSAFVPTAWAISGATGMLLWPVSPLLATVVAVGGGLLVTAATVASLMRFMLAHLGRNPFPSHLVLAVLTGFITLMGAAFLPLPPIVIPVSLLAAVALLARAALLPGVTHERPESISITDITRSDGSDRLYSPRSRQLSPALRRHLGASLQPLNDAAWREHLLAGKAAGSLPLAQAASAAIAPPTVTVVADETAEQRRLTVHCVSTGYAAVLSTDVEPLAVTIDAGDGLPLMHGTKSRVRFVNPPPEGFRVTFTLPAGTPCRLMASSWHLTDTPPELPASTSALYQRAAAVELAL